MELRPILSTLLRHKTAAALIVLEIALSCAIICNAVYLIGQRVQRISADSGVPESELIRVNITGIATDARPEAQTRVDLAALRALPGVKSVATASQVPFGHSSWNSSINLAPAQPRPTIDAAALYMGSEDLLETLGLRLVEGRDFNPDEYLDFLESQASGTNPSVMILTQSLARQLFPDGSAVGRTIYVWDDAPITVVGVVERLARPNQQGGAAAAGFSMIAPLRLPYTVGGTYLLRVDPQRRDELLDAAASTLEKAAPDRIILGKDTFGEIRARYFRQDVAMVWLLVSVCIALLVVTALGIVGLASFWVQQRTKQIGVRRALGATRRQVLRYFQTENFLLASIGIALGMLGAYAINLLLMSHYELPRLPLAYLPIGAVALWLLGQLAVLGPALRAAAVPPAVATRTL